MDEFGIIFYGQRDARVPQAEDGALLLERAHLIVNRSGTQEVTAIMHRDRIFLKVDDALQLEIIIDPQTRISLEPFHEVGRSL